MITAQQQKSDDCLNIRGLKYLQNWFRSVKWTNMNSCNTWDYHYKGGWCVGCRRNHTVILLRFYCGGKREAVVTYLKWQIWEANTGLVTFGNLIPKQMEPKYAWESTSITWHACCTTQTPFDGRTTIVLLVCDTFISSLHLTYIRACFSP